MSLDRLINLARRTGDRLIVHQPEKGEDIVIMDVDEYELLLDNRRDVRALSDKQLLDQINRDIAIWRANSRFDEEDFTGEFDSDDEDNFDWSSTANILEDRFEDTNYDWSGEFVGDRVEFADKGTLTPILDRDEIQMEIGNEISEKEGKSMMGEIGEFFDSRESEEDVFTDKEVENQKKKEEPKLIPEKPVDVNEALWEEESLGDGEPVFYEEPV